MYCSLQSEEEVLAKARSILESRLCKLADMRSPQDVKDFLVLNAQGKDHEELHVMFLNDACEMIAFEKMGIGTHDMVEVSPRDVAIAALRHKATGIVITHNHPVGSSEPSKEDLHFTQNMQEALQLIDVQLVDHFVVGKNEVTSINEFTSSPKHHSQLMEALRKYSSDDLKWISIDALNGD